MLKHLTTPWISHANPNILPAHYFGLRRQTRDGGPSCDAALATGLKAKAPSSRRFAGALQKLATIVNALFRVDACGDGGAHAPR